MGAKIDSPRQALMLGIGVYIALDIYISSLFLVFAIILFYGGVTM